MEGKKNMQRSTKIGELNIKYNAFFPIHSEEKSKNFIFLLKHEFRLPKFFDNDILIDIRLDEDVELLYDQMGWSKYVNLKFDTFYELIVDFYITFKIIDEKDQIYSCRFFGKEHKFYHAIMSEVFGFL